ncbi:hypothetical protein B0T16DRAFT_397210 [Cercophora newfieldiana]|uniref:Uncharacterized protein n=1 Tax=Cercophora newfieldiana TaxID=92897 RepID=A0AA39YPV4_9PEZI|nr:hypothetical protein B0T16DRAFT_397210 [Cercophora newfieldiana]
MDAFCCRWSLLLSRAYGSMGIRGMAEPSTLVEVLIMACLAHPFVFRGQSDRSVWLCTTNTIDLDQCSGLIRTPW